LKLHAKILGSAFAAILAVLLAVTVAHGEGASQCAAQCYAQEKACMRATKGGASCDAVLTRCLQGCRARR
jgi:hypothetical protein